MKTARPPRPRAAAARSAVETPDIATQGGTPRRFLGRIDRYVGAAYLRFLGFALAASYLIFGLVELQGLMDGILDSQQPMSLILDYFKYFAPTVLDVILPIVCLVAAVVAITVLSRSGELVAIKASGIGMRRTTVPVLMVTVVLCGLLFLVEDRIAPSATRKAQALRDQINGHTPRTHGLPVHGRWTLGPEGRRLYHYRLYVPAKQDFRGLTVFTLDRDGPRVLDHLYADYARWTGDEWDLRDGWYRSFFPERLELFENSRQAALDDPEYLVGQENRLATGNLGDLPEQLSIAELAEQIESLRNSGYDITSLRVAYHGKFSRAIAPLVMVLLGLPFAFQVGRRGSLYGIGVALLLVLVYWATFAIFNALGMESLLLPVVAAWAPNVMFGLVGFYMMLYVRT
jgi:LPS export ABC transporter permease LptG